MPSQQAENETYFLEVIACSVEDAVNAEIGGADRLEIIRGFEFGGFTPPLDLVRKVREAVQLPMRVMLREEPCYGLTEVITVDKLCCMANEFNKMKVDGVVIGFLQSREVDVKLTGKILACAPDLKATFHHAFENTNDKVTAIRQIKRIPQIDRILSNGGLGSSTERIENLREYVAGANPEIRIIAGGQVDLQMIRELKQRSQIREFHVGRAARSDGKVDPEKVQKLAGAVRGLYV